MAESQFWDAPIDTGPIPDSESRFDVIVVGGPGGSAAAGYLAQAGEESTIDREGNLAKGQNLRRCCRRKIPQSCKSVGVKEQLETTPHFRVTGITFSSPNGVHVNVPLPEEDVQRLEAGYALPQKTI